LSAKGPQRVTVIVGWLGRSSSKITNESLLQASLRGIFEKLVGVRTRHWLQGFM